MEGDLLFSAGGGVGAVVPGVGSPGEVLCDVHPQEFSTADFVHSRAVDGQWGWSTEFLLKSITTFFVFPTLRDRLLTPHYLASCVTFSL